MKSRRMFVCVACGIAASSSLGFFLGFSQGKDYRWQQQQIIHDQREAGWQQLRQDLTSIVGQFEGRAGIVVKDLRTQREIVFASQERFPSASLAKIPLMVACYAAAQEGKVKLDRQLALKGSDKLTGSGLLKEMPVSSTFTVKRLIDLMIADSDNTATHMLTNLLGLDYVNTTFSSWGLIHTRLSRKIADYRARSEGIENYTTAQEMALILEKIYTQEVGGRDVSQQCLRTLKLTRMNDRISKYLPAHITVAHKTGLEKGVCHDAGIVFTPGGDFILVVLTQHEQATSSAAKEFIAHIAKVTYDYVASFSGNGR